MKQDTRTTYRSWHAFTTIVLITACLSLCSVPNATYISSFSGWKSIGRKVKKGEKGIRIIAPVTIKVRQKSDEENQESPEEQEKLVAFRFAYVFDLEQTEGKELPFLSAAELTGKVPDYSKLMSAIRKISPVSIHYENLEATVKGYYDLTAKEIIIRSGMSELHTVKTALHEITHVLLHSDRMIRNLLLRGKQRQNL